MASAPTITTLARQIVAELEAAIEAAENLRRETRGIGVRLRTLLTATDPSKGRVHDARLMILAAIGRTEIGDQIRRSGGCHTGAERAVQLPADTDVGLLVEGLRRLAELTAEPE